jgi:hypothetical protein
VGVVNAGGCISIQPKDALVGACTDLSGDRRCICLVVSYFVLWVTQRGTKILAFPLTLLIMDVREADFHDKSLSSGARLSHSAQESAWLFR